MKNWQSANALILALVVMASLSALVGVSVTLTHNGGRNTARSGSHAEALSVANGVLEHAFAEWRSRIRSAGGSDLPAPSRYFFMTANNPSGAKIEPPQGSDLPGGYTINNFDIRAVTPQLTAMPSDSDQPTPERGVNDQDLGWNYVATADVTVDSVSGPVRAVVKRVFTKQQQSPWLYAIFYQDRLEIHPGPSQIIDGWVHTNENLFTAHDTLQFGDSVTYVGDHFLSYDPENTARGNNGAPANLPPGQYYQDGVVYDGNVSPAIPLYRPGGDILSDGTADNWSVDLPPVRTTTQSVVDFDPTSTFDPNYFDPNIAPDANQDNDGYHELIEPPANDVSYADPLGEARLYNVADYKVRIDQNNNIEVRNAADMVLPVTDPAYVALSDAITTGEGLRDHRESGEVRVSTLDVSKVTEAVDTTRVLDSSDGTIIYIYDDSVGIPAEAVVGGTTPVTTSKRGIRLKNGAVLPSAGLTVVSANPVYIQGDYNTGSSQPNSNTTSNYEADDPTPSPTVSGYTRSPSAVIGDAVNILSNSWSDAASLTSSRTASNTTINTAIVSGNIKSGSVGGTNYSGGAENFPRFLENWSGKYFTYYGSLIQLYQSQQATGKWETASYNPPKRRWFFDETFRENPPPGILRTVSYNRGRWYLE